MIRMAYITTENPYDITNNGGIGTYTGIIAQGMARLGHQIHCITIGNDRDREIDSNFMLHNIPGSQAHHSFYLENINSFAEKIYEIRSLYGLDIVESPEWMAQGNFISNIKSIPLVTRLHTPLFLIEDILDGQKIYRKSEDIKQLEKEQAINSCGITSPCTSLSKLVEDRWQVKSTVIANPINTSAFDSQALNNTENDKEQIILYMGRLEYRKGVLILAECLKDVLLYNQNIKVVFCGQDSLYKKRSVKSRILELCKDFEKRLVFISHAKFEEKLSLMKQAILVVLPSIWENFSYVALEAMCMAKTIVASNAGGYPEMIEDGSSGYLVEPNSPFALASKINMILNKNLPQTGCMARKSVKEKFDINMLSHDFEKYYLSIIR